MSEDGSLTITVPGFAVPQGRPRFARIGKGVRVYDPKASRTWKEAVRLFAAQAMTGRPMLECPVYVWIGFFYPCPKSAMRKRSRAPAMWKGTKPDLENLEKGLLDGCTGIVWRDDAQVACKFSKKVMLGQDSALQPHVKMRVVPLLVVSDTAVESSP